MTDRAETERDGPATVLVVDDSRVSGRKLTKAVKVLGHDAELVTGGAEALRRLQAEPFDIVLLDIVMPEIDGYAVLSAMKSDATLREIPVIVISSLDDEIDSVARAIELGAEDFLPKNFEPAILRARMNSSLTRKRFRDRELAYFRDIDTLTKAAQIIEDGAFRPADLDVEKVATRHDPLGGLAVVLRSLAEEIFAREQRADLTVRTLRGTLLVLAAGSIFGIAPALGRLASARDVPPLGMVFWAAIVAAVLCLSVSIVRRGLPRVRPRDFVFLGLWAVLLGCLFQLLTVVIAAHVEATLIALVGSSRGFIVFLLAALLAFEPPSLRRFFGLGLGFAAVAAVLLSRGVGQEGSMLWLAAAFVLPLLLSFHTLLMTWRPRHLDAGATVGLMMALSAFLLLPFAAAQDALFLPSASFGDREVITLAFGVCTAVAVMLALDLVATAGPVFAGQMAYSQTLAGIAWGMLLLGERLSPLAWGALIVVIVGFWLVEPKRAGDDFRITLKIRRR